MKLYLFVIQVLALFVFYCNAADAELKSHTGKWKCKDKPFYDTNDGLTFYYDDCHTSTYTCPHNETDPIRYISTDVTNYNETESKHVEVACKQAMGFDIESGSMPKIINNGFLNVIAVGLLSLILTYVM